MAGGSLVFKRYTLVVKGFIVQLLLGIKCFIQGMSQKGQDKLGPNIDHSCIEYRMQPSI